jgi:hypothetical protein
MGLLWWLADHLEDPRREASVPAPPFRASKQTAVILYGVGHGRLTPEQAREKAVSWGFPPEAIVEMLALATPPPSSWGRQQQSASDAKPGAQTGQPRD